MPYTFTTNCLIPLTIHSITLSLWAFYRIGKLLTRGLKNKMCYEWFKKKVAMMEWGANTTIFLLFDVELTIFAALNLMYPPWMLYEKGNDTFSSHPFLLFNWWLSLIYLCVIMISVPVIPLLTVPYPPPCPTLIHPYLMFKKGFHMEHSHANSGHSSKNLDLKVTSEIHMPRIRFLTPALTRSFRFLVSLRFFLFGVLLIWLSFWPFLQVASIFMVNFVYTILLYCKRPHEHRCEWVTELTVELLFLGAIGGFWVLIYDDHKEFISITNRVNIGWLIFVIYLIALWISFGVVIREVVDLVTKMCDYWGKEKHQETAAESAIKKVHVVSRIVSANRAFRSMQRGDGVPSRFGTTADQPPLSSDRRLVAGHDSHENPDFTLRPVQINSMRNLSGSKIPPKKPILNLSPRTSILKKSSFDKASGHKMNPLKDAEKDDHDHEPNHDKKENAHDSEQGEGKSEPKSGKGSKTPSRDPPRLLETPSEDQIRTMKKNKGNLAPPVDNFSPAQKKPLASHHPLFKSLFSDSASNVEGGGSGAESNNSPVIKNNLGKKLKKKTEEAKKAPIEVARQVKEQLKSRDLKKAIERSVNNKLADQKKNKIPKAMGQSDGSAASMPRANRIRLSHPRPKTQFEKKPIHISGESHGEGSKEKQKDQKDADKENTEPLQKKNKKKETNASKRSNALSQYQKSEDDKI